MKRLLKSRRALSTVVTTLIILVVAVMLASVVTYYAINVTTTKTQEESLQVYKQHIWNNGTTFSEAAFLLINTGGRDIVVDKITIRGQECDIQNVFYNKTSATISGDLPYIAPDIDGNLTGTSANVDDVNYTLVEGESGSNLILKAGNTMIVYIANPDHIANSDIGVTVGFTIFTANAQWYKECNVEAPT
jgi:hypothetical protein